MKYPQLVSARAVNAISDWLVSRLEQLGVEAAQIYTRLLLSLLQSSVQINDPIEFSNLEAFLANHKGNHRRYLQCDNDTLKKLNAVQCLREIVSSEYEITTIENLVEELCEKLKDIERQTDDSEDDDNALAAANFNSQSVFQHSHQQQQRLNSQHNTHYNREEQLEHGEGAASTSAAAAHAPIVAADTETDPKKRYFRAFPALSKEMEDSFRIWRRNAKSLTWPVDRANISSISNSSSSSTLSSSFGSSSGSSGVPKTRAADPDCVGKIGEFVKGSKQGDGEKENKAVGHLSTLHAEGRQKAEAGVGAVGGVGGGNSGIGGVTAAAAVKRKSKRRRNQALSKGKTIQNIRKNCNPSSGFIASTSSGRYQRNSSPTNFWDTDFEGCWEMGPDLIKEFITRQNKQQQHQRNRSTSESAAYNSGAGQSRKNVLAVSAAVQQQQQQQQEHSEMPQTNNPSDSCALPKVVGEKKSAAASPQLLMPAVDISFCCGDDDYDDTLASISELTNDTVTLIAPPRRLYQRDASSGARELLCEGDEQERQLKNLPLLHVEDEETANSLSDEQLDFAQFKAKFNSSVEALWDDVEPEATEPAMNVFSAFSAAVNIGDASTWPAVAPFKEDLRSFWTNYNNHRFDLDKMPEQQEESTSMSLSGRHAKGRFARFDDKNTSDYYSMPSNLEHFDKSVGGEQMRTRGKPNASPLSLFLLDSIWTESGNSGAGDTDESFYYKVWNSTKKLNQLESKLSAAGDVNAPSKLLRDDKFNFAHYTASKWSEGINAGPPVPPQQQLQQQQQQQQLHSLRVAANPVVNNNNLHAMSIDCTDSSATASVSSASCCSSAYTHSSNAAAAYNWQQTPLIGQQMLQSAADVQSWAASNPMSLTEMYGGGGGGGGASGSNNNLNALQAAAEITPSVGPVAPVTLPNHSPKSSGFIEYARIKTLALRENIAIAKPPPPPAQNYAARLRERHYSTDTDADENLLTSERTHFHPIKTYADGHTFDICSSLDLIEYERSASGYLYLEADRYLEYTRNENYMPEEDNGAGASATPLYASSNCDAAVARNAAVAAAGATLKPKRNTEFVIKYRLRNSDMACQTEDVPPQPPVVQHPLQLIFSGTTKLQTTSLACNDAIEALNKAVAAAAKAAAAANLPTDSHWHPTATSLYPATTASLWTAPQVQADESATCDEIDFVNSGNSVGLEQQQWSMHEIGKKCELAGHGGGGGTNNNINMRGSNNNNNNGIQEGGMHTLWGMCAACNSELKSVPANRMLRDELQQEADEIMSDLKHMQDLYIGRSGSAEPEADVTSGSEWGDVEEQADALHLVDDDIDEDDEEEEDVAEDCHSDAATCDLAQVEAEEMKLPPSEPQLAPPTHAVLQKVNQLITDLLQRPEKTAAEHNLPLEDLTGGGLQRQFSGGLWHNEHNERNIWQLQKGEEEEQAIFPSAVVLKPLELLRQFNVEPPASAQQGFGGGNDDNDLLVQLSSWEHGNLAEIWQKKSPPPLPASTTRAIVEGEEQTQLKVGDTNEEEALIADKNLKNLRLSAAAAAASSAPYSADSTTAAISAAAVAYRRVQQFLSDSNASVNAAAKLKLANRKRRHSASQTSHSANAANNAIAANNNNIGNLSDFNQRFGIKLDDEDAQPMLVNDVDMDACKKSNAIYSADGGESDGNGNGNDNGERLKQTIITCKYWTIDPAATLVHQRETMDDDLMDMMEGVAAGTTFSCLIDKNASILKHMSMVTRPLTR